MPTLCLDNNQVTQTKYLQDSGDFVAGETLITEYEYAYKGTFTFKEVKLQMKDYSKLQASESSYNVSSMFNLDLGL